MFDASSLAEFHRKQTETNSTPPSNILKNFDPAVERTILRCLDRDPSQRPRSALSVAASLLGGDPLVSALAAGETPLPETVAAPGPQGSLRPAVAWACLAGALILIFGASILLAPRNMDWILDRWYAGRAMIALLLPLILLFWGFYVSLGGQPIFGSALKYE